MFETLTFFFYLKHQLRVLIILSVQIFSILVEIFVEENVSFKFFTDATNNDSLIER